MPLINSIQKLNFDVFIFIILSVSSQRSPTISYISQEQIKDIGEVVELICSVQYSQEYPVLWMKGDSPGVPISSLSSLILQDSRYAIRYDRVNIYEFNQSCKRVVNLLLIL